MKRTVKRNLAIGAAALVAFAGGGVATAASDGDRGREAPLGPGGPHHRVHLAGPGPLAGAAEHLGLSEAELRRRLGNGRSLAQVAKAEGKSVEGLQDAIVAAAEEELDAAVADGALTAQERDRMLERLRDHVDELVAGRGPGGGPCPRGMRGAPGAPGFHMERAPLPAPGGEERRGAVAPADALRVVPG